MMVKRRNLLLVAVAAAVAIAAGLGAWLVLTQGPLAGQWRHDFGDVSVPPDGTTVRHTFVLTNRRNHTLAIQHVIPSCGCAKAETSSKTVEPGATVSVAVEFFLEGTGKKFVNVQLDLGDDGMTTLTVVAMRRASDG